MKRRKDTLRPTDLCHLCETEYASQRDSHILPKFMGKILFKDNSRHHVYRVSAESFQLKPEILQDTIKESYLFCPSCESYLGILDGYFSEHVHKLILHNQGPVYFDSTTDSVDTTILSSKKSDPLMSFLFIDSILFRCHLSNISPFQNFSLPPITFTEIKIQLLKFKSQKGTDVLSKCKNEVDNFDFHPFMIATPREWSENFLSPQTCSLSNANPLWILGGSYLIMSYPNGVKGDPSHFNINSDPTKILIFAEKIWNLLPSATLRKLVRDNNIFEAGNQAD